jgi:hypothetical protein
MADIHLSPSLTALPGSAVLVQLANGLAAWSLVAAGIALVVGAALWALGSHSQNMHQSMAGRRTVFTALGAALLIGASDPLINFFFHAGTSVH